MNKFIACEVGNYDTKLMTREKSIMGYSKLKDGNILTNEESIVLGIVNIVAPAYERRSLKLTEDSLINLLDVTIKTKEEEANGRWFVGNIALKEGSQIIKPTREDEKRKNPTTIIMLLTSIAFALYEPSRPVKAESITLGTLLPTEEYFKEGYVDEFKKKLIGEHTVTFNDPAFKSAEISFKIDSNIEVMPEGGAGLVATVFDWEGYTYDDNYDKKTIMNIDIGYIDTDVSILQNGDFLSKGFFGIKSGISDVLRNIANQIYLEYNYKIDTHLLDYHIRNNIPLMIGTKSVNNLKEMANKQFAQNAWLFSNKLTEELRDKAIDKQELNEVNLIGGGINFYVKGLKKHFETGHMKLKVPTNTRFKNVEGLLKSLLIKQRRNNKNKS